MEKIPPCAVCNINPYTPKPMKKAMPVKRPVPTFMTSVSQATQTNSKFKLKQR